MSRDVDKYSTLRSSTTGKSAARTSVRILPTCLGSPYFTYAMSSQKTISSESRQLPVRLRLSRSRALTRERLLPWPVAVPPAHHPTRPPCDRRWNEKSKGSVQDRK